MNKHFHHLKKYLEIYFWVSSGIVFFINLLLVLPGIRRHSIVLWLENYILDHWNSPLEEIQVVIVIFVIFQIAKLPAGWFKYIHLAGFIFIFGEEIAWGNTYINVPKIPFIKDFMTSRGDLHNHEVMRAEVLDVMIVLGSLYMAVAVFSEKHFTKIKKLLKFPPINLTDSHANMFIFGSLMSYCNLIDETSVIDTVFIQSFYVIFAIIFLYLHNNKPLPPCSSKKLNICYALAIIQIPRVTLLALLERFHVFAV